MGSLLTVVSSCYPYSKVSFELNFDFSDALLTSMPFIVLNKKFSNFLRFLVLSIQIYPLILNTFYKASFYAPIAWDHLYPF